MTDAELGWAAGIIDGEGCIGLYERGRSHTLMVSVQMTHKLSIERLKSLLKVGNIYYSPPQRKNQKECWRYTACGEDAVTVLKQLQLYLYTKRQQADLGIEYGERCLHERLNGLPVPEDKRQLRLIIAEELADLNKRGL